MSYSFLGLVPCGNSRAVVGGAGIGAVLERLAELHVEVARAEQSGEQQALDAPPSCGETFSDLQRSAVTVTLFRRF